MASERSSAMRGTDAAGWRRPFGSANLDLRRGFSGDLNSKLCADRPISREPHGQLYASGGALTRRKGGPPSREGGVFCSPFVSGTSQPLPTSTTSKWPGSNGCDQSPRDSDSNRTVIMGGTSAVGRRLTCSTTNPEYRGAQGSCLRQWRETSARTSISVLRVESAFSISPCRNWW